MTARVIRKMFGHLLRLHQSFNLNPHCLIREKVIRLTAIGERTYNVVSLGSVIVTSEI